MDPMSDKSHLPTPSFETICGHFAEDPQQFHGAVIPPIFQNSLFAYPTIQSLGSPERYNYTRVRNPTSDILEKKLAELEGAEIGRCFGSGMGAISAAILACVKGGDHVVAVEHCYGPTAAFFSYLEKFGVSTTYVSGDDPQQFAYASRDNTTLFYLESPTSLFFELQDIPAITALARARGISTIADNSYCTPYFQNPIAMGVDFVVHTTTKYIGGHSDVVGGVAVGSRERMEKMLTQEAELIGAVLDPFGSWLTLRGLRTLPVRMERHFESANRIAHWLVEQPQIEQVNYPTLPGYPQAELYRRQMRGACGLISFVPKDRDREKISNALNVLRYYRFGCSWGGFESLCIPGQWEELGEGQTRALIRLHIGLENPDDLMADLQNALCRM